MFPPTVSSETSLLLTVFFFLLDLVAFVAFLTFNFHLSPPPSLHLRTDWNEQTIASWRHSVWVGIVDPRGFIFKPRQYFKCVRDGYCLERMHRAFDRGLMEYGMFRATKMETTKKGDDAAKIEKEGEIVM